MPKLYHITLSNSTLIKKTLTGSFSTPKANEVLILYSDNRIELNRITKEDQLEPFYSTKTFANIRSIDAFVYLTPSSSLSFIVIGSDSGKIALCYYNKTSNKIEQIGEEMIGRSGNWRTVPGAHVVSDYIGRCLLVCADEQKKFVYVLHKNTDHRTTSSDQKPLDKIHYLDLSSPLCLDHPGVILLSIVTLHTGFENPLFAAIEYDKSIRDSNGAPSPLLTIYEMDIGINVMKRRIPLELSDFIKGVDEPNLIIPLPLNSKKYSSFIICGNNGSIALCSTRLILKEQEKKPCTICVDFLQNTDFKNEVFIDYSVYTSRSLGSFILVLTNKNQLLSISLDDEQKVLEKISKFDRIPKNLIPNSISIFKTGHLFVTCQSGSYHFLSKFLSMENEDDGDDREMKNLSITQSFQNISPIWDCELTDVHNFGNPTLNITSGLSNNGLGKGSLNSLQYGIGFSEIAQSPLPGTVSKVWEIKNYKGDTKYLVLSFVDHFLLVLEIGSSVSEVANCAGFFNSIPTWSIGHVNPDVNTLLMYQVHQNGIRLVSSNGVFFDWTCPGQLVSIANGDNNGRQIVIFTGSGHLVYLSCTPAGGGSIVEEARREMKSEVKSISVCPTDRNSSDFAMVLLSDHTIRVLSLRQNDVLQQKSAMSLPSPGDSICFSDNSDLNVNNAYVSLTNGVILKVSVDLITGALSSDYSLLYSGSPLPSKLYRTGLSNLPIVGTNSSHSFSISRASLNTLKIAPLYEKMDKSVQKISNVSVCPFYSEFLGGGGIVCVSNVLKLLKMENSHSFINTIGDHQVDDEDNPSNIPILNELNSLNCTPRKIIKIPPPISLDQLKEKIHVDEMFLGITGHSAANGNFYMTNPLSFSSGILTSLGEHHVPRVTCGTVAYFEKLKNHKPILVLGKSISNNVFSGDRNSATIDNLSVSGHIDTYLYTTDGDEINFLHQTPLLPGETAFCASPFLGKLLVGVSNGVLRLYDIGKKQLLRKCEYRNIPFCISKIQVVHDRIFVSDVAESILVLKYKENENKFFVLADDTSPRFIVDFICLDYNTVICSDKFGNVSVLRVPISDDQSGAFVGVDLSGLRLKDDTSFISGNCPKLERICHYHMGDIITSFNKIKLNSGGIEVILYSTVLGAIGAFVPFLNKKDYDIFEKVQTICHDLKSIISTSNITDISLNNLGRHHFSYRSSGSFPLKGFVDGDYIESMLSAIIDCEEGNLEVEKFVGLKMGEIYRKLEEMRGLVF